MSPEIARSRARRALRVAAAALVLASGSFVWTAVLFAKAHGTDREIQNSRAVVADTICDGIGTLIIRGATDSKAFEPLIRQAAPDAPTYEMRVTQARTDARTLCLKIKRETATPSP